MRSDLALVILVKFPEAGRTKTRLAAGVGTALAVELYKYFVHQVFSLARQFKSADTLVAFSPPEKAQKLKQLFPYEFEWFAQVRSPDLGDRIREAMQHVLALGYSRVLIIGTDSPSLPLDYLGQAADKLYNHDVVFGPAADGGYYLIGAKLAHPSLFEGIAWSTDKVLQQSLLRAQHAGLSCDLLPPWYDIDQLDDLRRLLQDLELPPGLRKRVAERL